MDALTYKITTSTTVKAYLRRQLGLSARVVIGLKENGIQINGQHARTVDTLIPGDILSLFIAEAPAKKYPPQDIPLQVLYEDQGFLIVNKPPYMPVYPVGSHKDGSLLNAVAFTHANLTFRPLYRLDRNTSGVLVIAKTKLAAGVKMEKQYLAVCQGLTPKAGVIHTPIGLMEGSKIKRVAGQGQAALTRFTTVAQHGGYSLVQVAIETGRTHQIRVHMASIGFPLSGDNLYGGATDCILRHGLHCHTVAVNSIPYKLNLTICAPLPQDITQAFPILCGAYGQ